MAETLFTIPLSCVEKCPFKVDDFHPCGTGISGEKEPCKTEVQETEGNLSKEERATEVRHVVDSERVDVFISDWPDPNLDDWRMWEHAARIENGKIIYF